MLLNPALEKYLADLGLAIHGLIDAYIERYEEEVITSDRINVRIRIRMANESLLEINEAVVADNNHIRHLGYRYPSRTVRTTSFLDTTTLPIFLNYPAILTTSTSLTKSMYPKNRTF